MPIIDGVASYGPSALQQFQPRPPQTNTPASGETGSDNPAVQQFQINPVQTPPAAPPTAEPQTANAVQQPNPTQTSASPQPTAINNGSSNALSLSEILEQANSRPSPQNDPEPPSALNYNAAGAPNQVQKPTQAGQVVSLSV